MTEDAIRALAGQAGVEVDWIDASGRPQRVSSHAIARVLAGLGYPCTSPTELADSRERARSRTGQLPPLITATVNTPSIVPLADAPKSPVAELEFEGGGCESLTLRQCDAGLELPGIARAGYHRLRFGEKEVSLAIAPQRCVTLAEKTMGRKAWGIAVQLYGLSRDGDGGIGDTTALRSFLKGAAGRGADAIALSPTHSLFTADGTRYSPYSPSNRLFLNPLYADPADALPGIRVSGEMEMKGASLIDWPRTSAAKFASLRAVFDQVCEGPLPDFDKFVDAGGQRLREHALFEALQAHLIDRTSADWRKWPTAWKSAGGEAVSTFTRQSTHEIRYRLFLQWLADRSFARARSEAASHGMRIGLIADMAVGMDAAGSHAWSRPSDLLTDLSIGAPPDINMPRGQDWGLAGFSPTALVDCGFEPFIATIRAALRFASGARIDHAMGLMRLWLIPTDSSAAEGAFVRYPFEDMLRLLALESHRHSAVIVAEDLGTVTPAFRQRLCDSGIDGMDVLWFQRDAEKFLPRHLGVRMPWR